VYATNASISKNVACSRTVIPNTRPMGNDQRTSNP
jgi:hypothetical protein